MATIISHNIISPLGLTSAANYKAVAEGRTGLRLHSDYPGIPFKVMASMFADHPSAAGGSQPIRKDGESPAGFEYLSSIPEEGMDKSLTRFERLALSSIRVALEGCEIDPDRAVLILSTTKANVSDINNGQLSEKAMNPGKCADTLSDIIGIHNKPITVCNACISGVGAMITAQRLVDSGEYDYAIVCGADEQSPFIISGFQSFHSLSESECRPFDMERSGLNLGEAAATVIICRDDLAHPDHWRICSGAVRNDAYHTSTPHPQGEGARLALAQVVDITGKDMPAMINAHGTATMYNDQMESKAICNAGLAEVPVNAYKGCFGHTMGAAGVLETIITMLGLDEGKVLPTRNFSERGVSGKITVAGSVLHTDRKDFIKMISGFGGCNAAIRLAKNCEMDTRASECIVNGQKSDPASTKDATCCTTVCEVEITPESVTLNGEIQEYAETGDELIAEIYKKSVGDYPKFYKMDSLARLAFVASELLLRAEGKERFSECSDRAVVLFNSGSTIHADIKHAETISDMDNFFPSPSVFLYTLPNVAAGEIALRNKYHGETGFYLLPDNDEEMRRLLIKATFLDRCTADMIFGRVEYTDGHNFNASLQLLRRTS